MKTGKVVTVIPTRLGSNRVMLKGMRLLGEKTLVEHTLQTILDSQSLKETVFINSDAMQWKAVADDNGVEFYHRPPELATSSSMIDDYLYDFIRSVQCDHLAVITPTAPFITSSDLDRAWNAYANAKANTLISCELIQTHCYYRKQSLNFSTEGKLPRSQDLEPVHALNFSIALYQADHFKKFYEENGFAVLGGQIETFPLEGFSAIDIDEEKDFIMAELALRFQQEQVHYVKKYSPYFQEVIDQNTDPRN
jgi:CMP-N-acetylneuraminic acid synthetase